MSYHCHELARLHPRSSLFPLVKAAWHLGHRFAIGDLTTMQPRGDHASGMGWLAKFPRWAGPA
jgi:hypothetical protein